jgi:hypothetical protein
VLATVSAPWLLLAFGIPGAIFAASWVIIAVALHGAVEAIQDD